MIRHEKKMGGRSRAFWSAALLAGALGGLIYACGGAVAERRESPGLALDAAGGDTRGGRLPPVSEPVRQAEDKLAAGDAGGARAILERVVADNRADPRAQFDLAMALEMLGDEPGAERAYRAAIELREGFAEALNNLGVLLRSRGAIGEAVSLLRRAVEADPGSAARHQNLALALEDGGDLKNARVEYENALRLEPGDAMTQANLGLLLLSLKEPEAAKGELKTALSHAAGNRAALVAIGNGLRRAGDAPAAVEAMGAAIGAGDGKATPALLSELALAQRAADDQEGALASLRKAMDLDSSYATAHYLAARMLEETGGYSEALQHYTRYLQLEPKGPYAEQVRQRIASVKQLLGVKK